MVDNWFALGDPFLNELASEKTIKVHRAHIMHKMNAGSLADLVRMAEKLQIGSPRSDFSRENTWLAVLADESVNY